MLAYGYVKAVDAGVWVIWLGRWSALLLLKVVRQESPAAASQESTCTTPMDVFCLFTGR